MEKDGSGKESNINLHSESFSEACEHGLAHGGVHVVASKGHGKSRLLFGMARELRKKARVLIFDGSETWLYAFDKIPTLTIQERDIRLVNDVSSVEDVEHYAIVNWTEVEQALRSFNDILFRLKTRKPSKRGFFVRTVVNYLDKIQREQRASTEDNEARAYIAYFIEEAQDCFNSRSTTRLEAEEFLTVFNEARNQREAFFTASQRLTDFSKTIRTKQQYVIGRIGFEDKQGLRTVEKQHNVDFSKIPDRTWFLDGETFQSPTWKQSGKPYQINRRVRKALFQSVQKQQPQKQGLWSRLLGWLKPSPSSWISRHYGSLDSTEENALPFHDISYGEDTFEQEEDEYEQEEW